MWRGLSRLTDIDGRIIREKWWVIERLTGGRTPTAHTEQRNLVSATPRRQKKRTPM
jgi:hypothetical protein